MKIYIDALSNKPTVSIGTQALIIGSMEIISKYFKDVTFVMLSSFPEIEKNYLCKEPYEVKVIKRNDRQLTTIRIIRKILKEVDCVISAWGDGYITTPPPKMLRKTYFLKHRSKPLILFPSSMGPFNGKLKNIIAYKGLKQFNFIMARDTVTFNYLKELKVQNLSLVPDTAFILDPLNAKLVEKLMQREGVPAATHYIGLNVSQLLNRLFATTFKIDYSKFIAELICYLNDNFNCHILLLPHQISPNVFKKSDKSDQQFHGDDREAIKQIMKAVGGNNRVTPFLKEYSCRELKGIIGKCEFFIGGRMHSVIGALSMSVPSILMQYSHKAVGVMEMLGLKEFVWDIKEPQQELLNKISNVWENRSILSQRITVKMVEIKNDTWRAGEILKRAMEK